MGAIYRTSLLVFFLFFTYLSSCQNLDSLTTLIPKLTGRYSVFSVVNVNDSTYISQGTFTDYRPTTYSFNADSVQIGHYFWSVNCEKWQIDSVAVNPTTKVLTIKYKGKVGKSVPKTGIGAIIDYSPGFPRLPYGIEAGLYNCIWDDFSNTTGSSISASLNFDSNRPILRVPTPGVNIGGSTVVDFLTYYYFAPPTITCNLSPTTTVYEVGTSNSITISGATTNSGGATLSAGVLTRTVPSSNVVNSFGTGTSYSTGITFYPQKDSTGDYKQLTYSFQASQAWVSGAESGTASSTTRTITGVYPVLYGMDAADLSGATSSTIYTTLSGKYIMVEANKDQIPLAGVGEYIYFAIPKSWGDFNLSIIEDPNGFNILGGFTTYDVSITSSGLDNNWTQDYKLYKLNLPTTVIASPVQLYKFFQ